MHAGFDADERKDQSAFRCRDADDTHVTELVRNSRESLEASQAPESHQHNSTNVVNSKHVPMHMPREIIVLEIVGGILSNFSFAFFHRTAQGREGRNRRGISKIERGKKRSYDKNRWKAVGRKGNAGQYLQMRP